MRRLRLATIVLTMFAACGSEPVTPAPSTPARIVDVSGVPSTIRILVAPSGTYYQLTNGQAHGITVDAAEQLEQWLNRQAPPAVFDVVLAETPEERLVRDLLAGKGDIAANLLLTFERDDQVAFAKPIRSGIREWIVTGPGEKPLVSLEDVGGRSIHVRKTSDHYASLVRLNEQLTKINRPPAKIVIEPATRTDEALLALVNAGTIPATIADDYVFTQWHKTLKGIAANQDVAVSQDGVLAWVTRKDTPQLLSVVNEFFASAKATP